MNAEYYRITQNDFIGTITAQEVVDNESLYPERVIRGSGNIISIVDISFLNLFRRSTEGVDISADYLLKTTLGTLAFRAQGTKIISLKTQYSWNRPAYEAAGFHPSDSSGAAKYKAIGSLAWQKGSISAGWTMRYVSAYRQFGASGGPASQRTNGGVAPKEYSVSDFCDAITSKYNGALRDKALTSYLCAPEYRRLEKNADRKEFEVCVQSAMETMESDELRAYLIAKVGGYGIGESFSDGEFVDDKGKMIKLSEFRGRVLLVDVYSRFCGPCAMFAKTLREKVIPAFAGDRRIMFIAISVDSREEVWREALEAKSLVDPAFQTCLWSGPGALGHPFMRRYAISAVPVIFLVDQSGRIRNSSQNTLVASIAGDDLVKMINEVLE